MTGERSVVEPLRLGFLLYNVDGSGGIESQGRQFASRVAARGHRVVLVSTAAPRELARLEAHGWAPPPGVSVHRIPTTRPAVFERAAHAIFAREGGVSLLYSVQSWCGLHAARIARRTPCPTVCTFAGGGAYGDLRVLAARPGSERLFEELRRVDRYIFLSDEIRREAEELGLDPARFLTLRNGVDLARFHEGIAPAALPELGDVAGRRLVLSVGRLAEEKRPLVLLEAFARLSSREPRARLAAAGKGPLLSELEARVRALGLEGRAAYLGVRADVAALHRAASVFVLPSRTEGNPNALLEALAAGTPIVATDIPGVNEIVAHEREALLVPPDDPEALAAAILRLLRDQELAARLGRAGREKARRDFDLERVTDRHLELFRELVGAGPAEARRPWRAGLGGRLALGVGGLIRITARALGERGAPESRGPETTGPGSGLVGTPPGP